MAVQQGRRPVGERSVHVYVSANAAKSGKSVSPKVRQKGDDVWQAVSAKPGNAAGGHFGQPLELTRKEEPDYHGPFQRRAL